MDENPDIDMYSIILKRVSWAKKRKILAE
jgi:hypothetical protein